MKQGALQNIKYLRLKRILKLPAYAITGVLEHLWLTTYANARDGDIGRLSNDDIAAALEWDGEPNELIAALINSGWLDEDEQFRLVVHDWSEHCANWVKGILRREGRQFADEVAKSRTKCGTESATKWPTTSPSLNLTLPNTEAAEAAGGGEESAQGGSDTKALDQEVEIPESLDTPEFRTAWADWYAYRRESKLRAYVPRGAKAQLTKLAKLGHDAAIAAIEHSISQSYQGIIPAKGETGSSASSENGQPVPEVLPTNDDVNRLRQEAAQ